MMKKFALLFLPAAIGLLAAGCSRIEPENVEIPVDQEEEILISKSFQAGVAETRTTLDGVTVLFAQNESISIWDGSGNREYKADEAGSSVSFSGQVSASATEFFALSPYSSSTVFSRSGSTVTAKLTLPSTQEATVGTFADGMNISAAQSDSDDSFTMENVLAVAKFTLASTNLNGHQIASVELSSTYPLAGDVVVTYGEIPSAAAGSNTVNTVTLSHANGSALADGTYYLTLLPNAGGQITLKFTATDGYVATKTATLKSAFEAGSIKNLGTVKGLNWEGPKYVKVTAAPADWTGDYLLVYETGSVALGGIKVVNNNSVGDVKDVVITDEKTISWETYQNYNISIEKSENGYSLYLKGVGYLGWSSGNTLISATSVSSNSYRWSISLDADGNVLVQNLADSGRTIWCNPQNTRFCAYTKLGDYVKAVQIYKKTSGSSGSTGPSVSLTTLAATDITDATAVLQASYSGLSPINVQEVGFYWGTSAANMTQVAYDNSPFTTSSGNIAANLASLSPNTVYYYQVTMQVWDEVNRTYVEFKGAVMSFRTGGATPVSNWKGWLELPANTLTADNYIYDEYKVGTARNYSMSYDKSTYAAIWVAYPLYSATIAANSGNWTRPNNWSFNGHFSTDYQVDVTTKSYGVSWTESYGNELYARGHQIPNADRSNGNVSSDFQAQTFLVTNSTPQIQNRFNGSIWSGLETAVRNVAKGTDTVYVVTGPVFRKVGGSETIKYIHPQLDPTKDVPVPNYYWKALLKVKWSGDTVTSASAIGFWYEHKSYVNGETFDDETQGFIVPVKDIETWTGLDLFTNLPGDNDSGIEKDAQENTNWTGFKSF